LSYYYAGKAEVLKKPGDAERSAIGMIAWANLAEAA
jgi:hypothetical protein